MAYLRSVMCYKAFENIRKQNMGGRKIHLGFTSKRTSTVQANRVFKVDDLHDKSGQNFGEMKQNSTLMKTKKCSTKSEIDVSKLVEYDIKTLFEDIRAELKSRTNNSELLGMATYYVDGKGKAIRPIMATLMGKSLNFHVSNGSKVPLSLCQRRVAMITEMTHTASLMHDDLLDGEELRRGHPSMVSLNHQKVARAGDFVSGTISSLIECLKQYDARIILYKMSRDLALGEFLQLDSANSDTEDLFSRYLNVIHLKAAVLFASSCEAQAILAGADFFLREGALQYGRNIGMAFQLADDFKDFEFDLSQGVITAPVLLACKKNRNLEGLVLRNFSEKGDLEMAFDMVYKARGLEETKKLVQRYCNEALRHASLICGSPYQNGLSNICELILNLVSQPQRRLLNK